MIIATILYIIVCLLFILFSLLQQTESGGLGILGGSSNSLLGSNKASVLTKITSFFAVIFILSALVLSILSSGERSIFEAQPNDINQTTTEENLEDSPTINSLTNE